MALNTVVIIGSVRNSREGIKAAKFIINELKRRKKHKITFIDPKEYNLPMLDKRIFDYPKGKAPEKLKKLSKVFKSADSFVIVSAEYNSTIPPGLTNLLDHFYPEFNYKTSGIICYSGGSYGGSRAQVHLRSFLVELGMTPILNSILIPEIQNAFDNNGKPFDEKYHKRADKFLAQLEWYANALKEARKKATPP